MADENIIVIMGKRIRSIRKEKKMTQEQFAATLGISQQILSRYETGQTVLPYEDLKNIVKEFNVSVEYILGIDAKDFTDRERRIIDHYRNINDKLKPCVEHLLQTMAADFPKEQK